MIENMAASSANKNQENDRCKKVNSVDTKWRDELTAKVDLILKNNQGEVFIMEDAMAEQITQEAALEAEKKGED